MEKESAEIVLDILLKSYMMSRTGKGVSMASNRELMETFIASEYVSGLLVQIMHLRQRITELEGSPALKPAVAPGREATGAFSDELASYANERIAELKAALRFIQRTTEENGTREVASEALGRKRE